MEGGSRFVAKKQIEEEQKQMNNPAMRLLVISSPEGAVFYKVVEGDAQKKTPTTLEQDKEFPTYPGAVIGKFAPYTGKYAVIADEIGIHFVDCMTGKESRLIVKSGVTAMSVSPRDSYLITCEKYQQGEKNLVVWDTKLGKEVAEFEWKKTSKEGPKTIKFSKEERFAARFASKTSIEVYENGNFTEPKAKINATAENLAKKGKKDQQQPEKGKSSYWFDGFEFIPNDPTQLTQHQYLLAWQNCEGLSEKQDVGGVVYAFDLLSDPTKPKFSVQCSKSQEIQVKPSPTGYAVLIWSQNFVDSSGKSYYGEHSCQYVQLLGGKARVFVPVFDGMIHDLAWVGNGEKFIVISGMQPAVATLYDKNSNPLFEFGKRYRNTVRVCPFSQTALIGGFGNLAGEIDFWNLDNHKELGKTKAHCTVGIEWAPNGKYMLSSVLFERVKVDNEVRVFLANGKLLCTKSYKTSELHEVHWQPYPLGSIQKPDLRQLHTVIEEEKQQQQAKPRKFFMPPGGNSIFSQIMRQEMSKTNEKGPKKVDHEQYKGLMKEQAQQHAESLANTNISESPQSKGGWRKGYEQQQEVVAPVQFVIEEEKKVSKHAKRRAKKKIVVEKDVVDQ